MAKAAGPVRWQSFHDAIARNRWKTIALVIFFFLLLAGVIAVFGAVSEIGPIIVPIAVAVSLVATWGSYYYSDRIVLSISQARPVEKKEFPYLFHINEALAIGAGIPVPRLYIIEDSAPNAFATGRNPKNGVICVTRGLLEKLNREELEGVIAHEMSHIKNYDMLLGTVAVTMVGIIVLLSDWMLRFGFRSGHRRSRSSSSAGGGSAGAILLLIGLVFAVLAPLFAQVLRFSLSRRREFQADASAVRLTRYPPGLASALKKIAADPAPLKVANKATAHLYIWNPLKDQEGPMDRLFNTHPAAAERIKILESMS